MRRRVRLATHGTTNPNVAADALAHALFTGYADARARARAAGADRVVEQVATIEPHATDPYRGRPRGLSTDFGDFAREQRRAQRATQGHVKHWWQSWYEAEEAGQAQPIKAANRAQAWRVEMATATENAEAFGVGQDDALDLLVRNDPFLAQSLFKVWDAALDKRTCQTCERAHGLVVRIDEPFPAGRPGGVHPNCRCVEQILPADWVDLSRYEGSRFAGAA